MQASLIDFSRCEALVNNYDGAAYKHPIRYNGETYMLKYGELSKPQNTDQTSYINSPVSEFLGSHCFAALGIQTQDTLLGTYNGHSVVACKDFMQKLDKSKLELVEFKRQERSFVGWSSQVLKTPRLENILGVFDSSPAFRDIRQQAEEDYWKMFIGDALFANFDRHAGNWGYILDIETNKFTRCAPVYDCGGCMTPRLSEKAMARIMSDPQELRARAMRFPTACILVDGKRPSYDRFFRSPEADRCLPVIAEFVPTIDLDEVHAVIEKAPGISDVRREYLCKTIDSRYDNILLPAYDRASRELARSKTLRSERSQASPNPYMSPIAFSDELMKGYSGPLPGSSALSARNTYPPRSSAR